MVKGKKGSSGSDAGPLKKVKGDWESSCISEHHLAGFQADGRLPPADSGRVRCPGNEVIPNPHAGERVMFLDVLTRGMSFPLHPFVQGLLCAYGIQLHDLPPNSFLHIACFITLCECFLGVYPH